MIVPTFTIVSSILCLVKNGLKPILLIAIFRTGIWMSQVLKKINKKTRAIIITHIYGFPVHMNKILKIARKKNNSYRRRS